MRDHEVIIVGGGPAGAAAAAVLARAGVSTLVLDKARFPRHKLCAGLLTWKTVRALERIFGVTADELAARGVINRSSSFYRIRHRERVLSEGGLVSPFHFVERAAFDAWCLEAARGLGAQVEQGTTVTGADPQAAVTTADGRSLKARWLIGADGALSRVRASLSLDDEAFRREQGMGLEVYLPCAWLAGRPGLHEDLTADFPTIFSGFVDAGYAWTFPHRERVIAGICGLYHGRPRGELKRNLDDFLRFLGLPARHGLEVKAHPLPYGNWLTRPHAGRVLLAGDAGGLVEPFFGEGIFYALRTGELAAQALLQALTRGLDPGERYRQDLERDIFPELRWSRLLRNLLYWFTRAGLTLPVKTFLGAGGTALQEMVHGMRSFRLLRKLDCHGAWQHAAKRPGT